jgi:hypothetical protein
METNCSTDFVRQQTLQMGILKDIEGIPDEIKRVFVIALGLSAKDHLLICRFDMAIENVGLVSPGMKTLSLLFFCLILGSRKSEFTC